VQANLSTSGVISEEAAGNIDVPMPSPVKWRYWVDARNSEIIERVNVLNQQAALEVTVDGSIRQEYPTDPATKHPLRGIMVNINNTAVVANDQGVEVAPKNRTGL
jgi:hypothetical protein